MLYFLACFTRTKGNWRKCEGDTSWYKKWLHFCDDKDIEQSRAESVEREIEIVQKIDSSGGLKFAKYRKLLLNFYVGIGNGVSEIKARFLKLAPTCTLKLAL